MIPHEDLQRLKGMKHIKYKHSDQDQAWQFMLRMTEELMVENQKLRDSNNELRASAGPDQQLQNNSGRTQ